MSNGGGVHQLNKLGALLVGCAAVALILGACAWAQPGNLYGTLSFNSVGARATALGGAYVAVADDLTGCYWNPAGAAYGESGFPDIEITGQSTGLRALQDLVTAGQSLLNLEQFQFSDLDRLFPVAESVSGQQIGLGFNPFFGFNVGNVGVHTVALSSGTFTMTTSRTDPSDPTNPNYRSVTITSPGALAIAQAGISYAKGVGEWDVGITVKTIGGAYVPGGTVTGTATNINDGTTFTSNTAGWGSPVFDQGPHIAVDLGAIKQTSPDTRFGIVVRNVNAPTLFTGANTLTIKPTIDVGFMHKPNEHFTIAFDLHNISAANGMPVTMHVGLERRVFDVAYLRVGLNNTTPTYGLGLDFGPARLDIGVGSKLTTQTAIGFHLEF